MKVKLQYERFYPSGDYCSPCDLFDGQECILRLDNGDGGPSQLCPIFGKEEGFYVFELAEGVEKLKSDNARLREALVSLKDAYCDNCMWIPDECDGCKTIKPVRGILEGKP